MRDYWVKPRPRTSLPGPLRALIGILLLVIIHLPRLIYLLLQLSYAAVFAAQDCQTANPTEHLERARKLLKSGRNSRLLYAALEIRLALERMVSYELVIARQVTTRMADEYDPTKKLKNLRRLDPASAFPHRFYFVNRDTGERAEVGSYRPMDPAYVSRIQGQLGDLLHPKEGIPFGFVNCPWYSETRTFLAEAHDYLVQFRKDNTAFFTYEGLKHIDAVRVE